MLKCYRLANSRLEHFNNQTRILDVRNLDCYRLAKSRLEHFNILTTKQLNISLPFKK